MSILRHNPENVTATKRQALEDLLNELKTKSNDDSYHSKTPQQISDILGRKLSKIEINIWRQYRNKVNKEAKKARYIRESSLAQQKAEEIRIQREKIKFSLVGLSDEQLLKKVVELQIMYRNKNLTGKASTNQLVIACNSHTNNELLLVAKQIEQISEKTIEDVTRFFSTTISAWEENPILEVEYAIRTVIQLNAVRIERAKSN